MEQFTAEELRNISVLIQKANITGAEATLVAILLQKIGKILELKPKLEPKEEKK